MKRGDEFLDEEGAFFLRCPFQVAPILLAIENPGFRGWQGRKPEIVACADAEGGRKAAGERWRTPDDFFANECVIGEAATTHRTVACIDAQEREVGNSCK